MTTKNQDTDGTEHAAGPVREGEEPLVLVGPPHSGLGFTDEQLAHVHDLLRANTSRKGRLRHLVQRSLVRGRSFVHAATPPDDQTHFPEDTASGRFLSRASHHRALTALAALLAIVLIGAFWAVVLGGGLPVPMVALILVAVLGTGVALSTVVLRRRQ